MSLTFFFSDIEDSTGLVRRLGDDYPPVLAEARTFVAEAVTQHGGREVDRRGDEQFCVFDEPEAGAAAALTVQRAFEAHDWPGHERVRIRIGLHSGEAASADDSYVGIDVHRASRICQAAHGGQVLASAEVASALGPMAQDLGTFVFRGLHQPERIYQLVADDLPAEFPPLRGVQTHNDAVRAVIADDSTLLREGLARLLEEVGIEVIAQARDADELMLKVRSYHPDVAIVDIRMPPTQSDEGIRAAREIRAKHSETGVLVLSQYVDHTYAVELLADGADGVGYLLKDRVADVSGFVDAVRRVAAGGSALDPEVVARMVGRKPADDRLSELTPREREVLELMAQGLSNKGICEQLVLSERAVERHITGVLAKLGIPATGQEHRRVLAVLAYLGN